MPDGTAELQTPTTDGEVAALAASIDAGDFADLELGAKIVGPRGPEVQTSLSNAGGIFADITSYVACPDGMEVCDPANAPEGTIYTYVHIVYPGEDMDPTTGAGAGTDDVDVETASAFMMTRPSFGFTGRAGFSKAEAEVAIGENNNLVITCGEDGNLTWTINAGDGGDEWEDAEPLTFYWQSVLPPAGPAESYAIKANDVTATGEGPYPAVDDTATNACTAIPTGS
ncbi:hypothetical protein IB285_06565 [Erythrobacter sp. KMU-140]|uniref:Uncharacterized protein n=2 Tax=Erythrobacter rubeus TaxID=2760803 RepID=A0ABR8KS71_9SPHN|nr:hypothetical protein [Erythrobacter rubeus]